jgi:hypothetical protein
VLPAAICCTAAQIAAAMSAALVGDDRQHRALPTLQPDLRLVINPGAGIPGTFGRARSLRLSSSGCA